jgi:hypothetical protein
LKIQNYQELAPVNYKGDPAKDPSKDLRPSLESHFHLLITAKKDLSQFMILSKIVLKQKLVLNFAHLSIKLFPSSI